MKVLFAIVAGLLAAVICWPWALFFALLSIPALVLGFTEALFCLSAAILLLVAPLGVIAGICGDT
jgi:hypothetical protein